MIPLGIVASGRRAAPALNYPATVLADSPSGYWRLNETTGTVMTDSSGNARHGTYYGVGGYTLGAAGLITGGGSVDFAAVTAGVKAAVPYAAWMQGPVTVEFIFQADVSDATESTMWARFAGDGPGIWLTNGTIRAKNNGNTDSTGWVAGVTYHIAHTVDAAGNCTTFRNGTQVGYYFNTVGPWTGTDRMTLGSKEVASGHGPFDGRMAEVAMYGSALSATRILAHAQAAGLA